MKAPESIGEIFERKKRSRRRYGHLPLIEKMQIALDLHRALQQIRSARPVDRTEPGS